MDEDLIASDDLAISRKSVLPGSGFFYPDSLDEELAERRVATALDGAEVVVVADSDADGLAATALVREAHDDVRRPPEPPTTDEEGGVAELGDDSEDGAADADDESEAVETEAEVTTGGETDVHASESAPDGAVDEPEPAPHRVAVVPASPHDVGDVLERVGAFAEPGIVAYVCDLCPDAIEDVEDGLSALVDLADEIAWYDHHQWDDDVAAAIREHGVDLVVGDSETECTADVALRSLESGRDSRFGEHLRELAAVTRDHDLWIREDPRSDDLADYAYWSNPNEFVEVVREHGPDLPEWVQTFLEDRRVEKEALIEQAVSRADVHEIGPYTVGVTYGRCSQNEVAEALREQGTDAAVVVKPAGSASIRGTDAFDRCHEVAGRVGGGGHPKAAGCKPDVYRDMLDYAHHWTTHGAVTKQVILEAFRDVVEEEAAMGADEPVEETS